MYYLRYSILSALLFLFFSCKKEPLPVSETDHPEFYFEADINGAHTLLKAGEANYFMHSSHYFDTNQVYVMSAELKQNGCSSSCGYGLSILINDKKMSAPGNSLNINEALHGGNYIFNDPSLPPLYYEALVKPIRNESPYESYRWLLNGQEVNAYCASFIVESGKKFVPVLNFQDAAGSCFTQHQNTYRPDSKLQAYVSAKKEGPVDVLMYSFSSCITGAGPYKYQWQFGDGNTYSGSERPFHTYQTQGFYTAKLTVIDSKNDTCVSQYQVPAFLDPGCEANFTAKFTPIPNTKAYSAITVLLSDQNGRVFSSKDLIQPESSRFEIIEIADYQHNENMEPTKKFKVRFTCLVQNGSEQILITNAEAVLAVSY